ncbi:MAG: hypothetical protein AAF357_06840 [Verrucomicrobiota bacterium]
MKERLVIPEILDSLPHRDPSARRSRRDLRFVNWLMGNYRWVRSRMAGSGVDDWFELGAGEGRLSFVSGVGMDSFTVTGVDFAPRPVDWPESWNWIQGDLFEALSGAAESRRSGCVAVLFLHHFKMPELRCLGEIMNERFVSLVVAEPARFRFFRVLAYALFPFVNRVTRHDMQVSIGAGFRSGELQEALGLSSEWEIEESVHWLGGYHFEAWRVSA